MVALFSYQSGSTFMHRQSSLVKILFFFALSAFAFWGGTPDSAREIFSRTVILKTAFCIAAGAALFVLSGADFKSLLSLRFVFIIGAMVTALKIIGEPKEALADGAAFGLLYTIRFFVSTLAAQCVFKTTTMLQIQEALRLPFAASLAISFIPQIFCEWKKIKLAARARGKKKFAKGLRGFFCKSADEAALTFYELEALVFLMLAKAECARKACANRKAF